MCVDDSGYHIVVHLLETATYMLCRNNCLVGSYMREHRLSRHISNRIDSRDIRAHLLIYKNFAFLPCSHAYLFEP